MKEIVFGVLIGIFRGSDDIERRPTGQHFVKKNSQRPPVHTDQEKISFNDYSYYPWIKNYKKKRSLKIMRHFWRCLIISKGSLGIWKVEPLETSLEDIEEPQMIPQFRYWKNPRVERTISSWWLIHSTWNCSLLRAGSPARYNWVFRRTWKWCHPGGYLPYTFRNPSVWCGLRDRGVRCPILNRGRWCPSRVGSWGPAIFRPNRNARAPRVTGADAACGTSNHHHGRIQWRRRAGTMFGNRSADPPKKDGSKPFQIRASQFAPSRYPTKHMNTFC